MSQRGQASIEFVGVVALVAVLLVLGAAAADAPAIGGRVVAQLARGLCVVTGSAACEADRAPCLVRWRRQERSWQGTVAVVRLGGGTLLLREERSDGSVALTMARDTAGGLQAGRALRVRFADVELRGALLAAGGHGTTWVFADAAAADRHLATIAAWRRGAGGPEPAIGSPASSYEERVPLRAEAAAGVRARGVAADAALAWEALRGVRRDHATGRTTTYLRRTHRVAASGSLRGKGATGTRVRRVASTEELAITRDAAGRPLELVLLRVDPDGAVPPEASAAAALLPASQGARTLVLEQRLDLADAASQRAAEAFLAGEEGVLRARLAEHGVVHVRAYEVGRRQEGAGAQVGVWGVGLGAGVEAVREQARLTGAITRDLGGGWAQRHDCLA